MTENHLKFINRFACPDQVILKVYWHRLTGSRIPFWMVRTGTNKNIREPRTAFHKKKTKKKKKQLDSDWTIADETVWICVSFTQQYTTFKHRQNLNLSMIFIVYYGWKIRPGILYLINHLFIYLFIIIIFMSHQNRVHVFKGRKVLKHAGRPILSCVLSVQG